MDIGSPLTAVPAIGLIIVGAWLINDRRQLARKLVDTDKWLWYLNRKQPDYKERVAIAYVVGTGCIVACIGAFSIIAVVLEHAFI